MPLVPRDFGGTVDIEFGDETVSLRRYLGWYHRQQASMIKGFAMQMPWRQVKDGDVRMADDDNVQMTIDQMEEVNLRRLMIWIADWTIVDPSTGKVAPVSQLTIKRLPQHMADRLIVEIERLEKEQDGPASDSPLATPSSAI